MDTSDSEISAINENLNTTQNVNDNHINKKVGRPSDRFWDYFTETAEPYKLLSSTCKHCGNVVNYHKKLEQAKTHLLKCPPFIRLMNGSPISTRPDWFNNKRSKKCGSNPSSSSSSLKQFFLPKMSETALQSLEEEIAMHYYLTGTSFQRIEEPHLLNAFKICHPDVVLPNRRKLGGALLNKAFESVQSKVLEYFSSPNMCVSIITDSWSNISNDSVVNYMAVGQKTFFLEAVYTGQQSHNAEWIASDISRVIENLPCRVAGATTDNASTNKAAWTILSKKYPLMFFQGCVSHGLHLLVKDIISPSKMVKKEVLSFPDLYPFENLNILTERASEIVTFLHRHHKTKSLLKELSASQKTKMLVKPAPTRWGSYSKCFQSLLESDQTVRNIVNERDFIQGAGKNREQRQRIREFILADNYVESLEKALSILNPIDKLITYFQNDKVPISEVYPSFIKLGEELSSIRGLNDAEKLYLTKLTVTRFNFLSSRSHSISYLLDPIHCGESLNFDLRSKFESLLLQYPNDDGRE